MRPRIVSLAMGLVLALPVTAAVAQQDDYPNRAVRVVAAAAPGGKSRRAGAPAIAAAVEVFGQSFIVENVPAPGGVLAAKRIVTSAPVMVTR